MKKEFSFRPQDLTVHLHWSGLAEMDLFALCETETGEISLVSFSAIGDDVAGVELLSDYTFQEFPTDNQEIIQVKKDAGLHWKRIWFWTWDFEQVESNLSRGFASLNYFWRLRARMYLCRETQWRTRRGILFVGVFDLGNVLDYDLDFSSCDGTSDG